MGGPKLFLLTVLVVASGTGVNSQFNFDNIKNDISTWGKGVGQSISSWGSGVGQDLSAWGKGVGREVSSWGSGIMNKINSFKDKAMEKFRGSMPESMREWIGRGNFSNANVSALVNTVPKKAWNAMKLEQMMTMGDKKLDELIVQGEGKIPKRVLDELKRMKMLNKTRDEALYELKAQTCRMGEMGPNCRLSKSTLMVYLAKLGNPADFKESNISELSTAIFNFPPRYLALMTDSRAIQVVMGLLRSCFDNPPNYCPQRKTAEVAWMMLARNLYGETDKWTAMNIRDMGGVAVLSPMVIADLSSNTLKDIKADLTRMTYSTAKSDDIRLILEALIIADGVPSMDKTAVSTWLNGLGNLKPYVLPWDVPPNALEDTGVNTTLNSNANTLATRNMLSAKDSKELTRRMLRGKSADTMTEAEVNSAGLTLADAPPSFLKSLVQRGVLKGNTLSTLVDNFKDSGPGSAAKGRMLLEAYTNTSNVRTLPASMLRYAPPSRLKMMSAAEVKEYLRKSEGKGWKLDDAQKVSLLSQLSTSDYNALPQALKSALPTSTINSLSSSQLQDFARGMPANTPAVLKIANMTFGPLRNVTLQDVQSNIKAIPLMTANDAEKISERDITEILKLFNTADSQPSMDVCRKLKKKLVLSAMKELDPENGMEVAQMMTVGEAENAPPCVLAALGEDALLNLRPEVKTTIMENMGKSDNSMSIPRDTRQLIIQEGMKPMGKLDMITGDLLNSLGNSAFDLKAEDIRKIQLEEAPGFLKNLEMAFATPMKPCLDSSQRREIATMIERVKGPPAQWDDVSDCCCLLEVLSGSQLSKIPPNVLSSCTCSRTVDGYEDFLDARASLCKSDIGEGDYESSMNSMAEVKTRQVEAALNTLDRQSVGRRKRAASDDSCASAAIGGAAVLSASEVQDMDNVTVLNCMAELTQVKMDDNMARTVFNRIRLAKNNQLDMFTVTELRKLQWAWDGIRADEVKNLTTLVYGAYNDVVAEMGKFWDLSQDVVNEMAKKVLMEWKVARDMLTTDLIIVRQLICGFNKTTIEAISSDNFKPAMPTINSLKNCPDAVTQALAEKAIAAYGRVEMWDATIVNEMGNLIGGMAPEKLMAIPSEAFVGITVNGMISIPPASIKALKVDQIENLPATVALSISAEQKNQFSKEMLEALEDILEGNNSGVKDMPPTVMMFLMASAMMLLK